MKRFLKKTLFTLSLLILQCAFAQKTAITIVHGGNFMKDETLYPGASVFTRDGEQVQFSHQGLSVWCDVALYYQAQNTMKTRGNVVLKEGDSITMNSDFMEYDGNSKMAKSYGNVVLNTKRAILTTDTLRLDRTSHQAFYDSFGTIKDSTNVLTSKKGRYFLGLKKFQFLNDVKLKNPDYVLTSSKLDYYTVSRHAYMYDSSKITGVDYVLYCERGYYDTRNKKGFFVKKSRIDYDKKIIFGDSLYFDQNRKFLSATNHIKILDTVNKSVLRGHYGEIHKSRDSLYITKRAVGVSLSQKDSIYVHGDTIMSTGKEKNRILRVYKKARIFFNQISGKCDSIHSSEKTGVTKLLRNPIIWNGENQITGDTIFLLSNPKTGVLDSLKVTNSAFMIEKDTLSSGYNQNKGKDIYGLFKNNEINVIDVVKNAELIYYVYDKAELTGINKSVSSVIHIELEGKKISTITFRENPDGDVFPEKDLPPEARTLKGFLWRGDERLKTVDELFDEDDVFSLPHIKGFTVEEVDAKEHELLDAPLGKKKP